MWNNSTLNRRSWNWRKSSLRWWHYTDSEKSEKEERVHELLETVQESKTVSRKWKKKIPAKNALVTALNEESNSKGKNKYTQPSWDVFGTSQSDLHVFFVTFLKASQIHLKKDVFSSDAFKTSQTYRKKYVYFVASLIGLKNISWKYLWLFKNIPQK